MHGFCNQCGKCCEAIRVDISPEEMKSNADYFKNHSIKLFITEKEKDYTFINEHWHSISEEEAFEINPFLKMQKEQWFDENVPQQHYYECDQYDSVNKRCMAHEDSPPVCKKYPYYNIDHIGELPEYFTWYSPTCDYIQANDAPGERALMIELALELSVR